MSIKTGFWGSKKIFIFSLIFMRASRVCWTFLAITKKWDLSDVDRVKKNDHASVSLDLYAMAGSPLTVGQATKTQPNVLFYIFKRLSIAFCTKQNINEMRKYICRSRTHWIAFLRTLFSVQCVNAWHFGSRINETKKKRFFHLF